MREIIFRGKRKSNGEWIFGFLSAPNEISAFKYYANGVDREFDVYPKTVGQLRASLTLTVKIFMKVIFSTATKLTALFVGIMTGGEFIILTLPVSRLVG